MRNTAESHTPHRMTHASTSAAMLAPIPDVARRQCFSTSCPSDDLWTVASATPSAPAIGFFVAQENGSAASSAVRRRDAGQGVILRACVDQEVGHCAARRYVCNVSIFQGGSCLENLASVERDRTTARRSMALPRATATVRCTSASSAETLSTRRAGRWWHTAAPTRLRSRSPAVPVGTSASLIIQNNYGFASPKTRSWRSLATSGSRTRSL